jgi:hypothetical protein
MSRYLTADKISDNWDSFLKTISSDFTGDRKDKLLQFYDKYANRIATMPASGKDTYHNCFMGGYVEHVFRVYNLAFSIKDTWKKNGANIDFTDEELAMVTLNHDLGKFGSPEHEYYIDQTESWKKEKGELYKHNGALNFMKTSDRTVFLLQSIGVTLTEKEWLGIHLHDGLYEDAAKSYYISYNDDYRLRTHLPFIVHQADLTATRIEYDLAHVKQEAPKTASTFTAIPEPVSPSKAMMTRETSKAKGKYAHLLKS